MAAVSCHGIQITEDCHMGTTGETVIPLHHWRLLTLRESHINIRSCHFRLPSFFQHNDTLFQYGMKTRKHHTDKTTPLAATLRHCPRHTAKSRTYFQYFHPNKASPSADVIRCRHLSHTTLFTGRWNHANFAKSEKDNEKRTSQQHSTP